jgi:uncharacterized protein YxeA
MTSSTKLARRILSLVVPLALLACARDAAAVTAGGVTADVVVTQNWGSGFNGAVRVTNVAFPSAITSFQVVFKLGGSATIQGNGWNGTISSPDASGNRTARNASWMGSLATGRTWDEGFTGTGAWAGATIVSLTVNGQNIPLGGTSDTTPPTVSLASSATSVTTAQTITLTATASDDVGVARVEFYDGTTLLVSDTASPYSTTVALTSANNGTKSYTARAFDAAGNSANSAAVPVTVNIPTGGDTTPPTVSLASNVTSVTTAQTITLTATASDNVGVTRVEFYDGTTLLVSDTTSPYSTTVALTSANNGTKSYTARAYDAAANNRTSTAVVVTVNIPTGGDTTPPTVSLASNVTNVTTAQTITLTATASDNVGVARVEFYDGTTLLVSDTTAPYTRAVSLTSANNGTKSYTARAFDAAGNNRTSTAVTVTVNIPTPDTTPPTAPTGLAASNLTSTSVTICWTVSTDDRGVTQYEIYRGTTLVGTTTTTCFTVTGLTANTAYSFTIRARDAAGNTSASSAALSITTPPAQTADVTLTVDTASGRRAISPYVYGYNAGRLADAPPGATYIRIGGNRWTAYNWTNNYSNAGADWGPYSNDTFMGTPSQGPGAAIAPTIADAKTNGIAALVTVPIQGWVSQARDGNVPLTDPVASWFVPNVPAKGSAFTLTPSATSTTVYQDELANFIANRWGTGATPHISLDNEPDLWGYVSNGAGTATHPEIQRTQLTYAAFLQQSVASASAIKAAVPSALVYGPVSYGWNGMLSFQDAPDKGSASIDNSFIDAYLAQMSAASTARRLLDVLDLHWYSEAQSNGCSPSGVRVINTDNSDCVVAARVQAPRSLFDPAYVETSWITQWTTASSAMGQAIQLVPRFLAKIASKYPGTKLAITEYNHGGEDHVSGAIAQADTLGIFGREGVYAGAFWSVNSSHAWSYAAWKAFRNYDGAGRNFGDTSVSASTSDVSHVSVYASVDAASASRLVLVIVHRPTIGASGTLDLASRTVQLNWTHAQALRTARAWRLASASSPSWQTVSVPAPTSNTLTLTLPALSVTTLELTP